MQCRTRGPLHELLHTRLVSPPDTLHGSLKAPSPFFVGGPYHAEIWLVSR